MRKRDYRPTEEFYRRLLWEDRSVILPHLQHASPCGVRGAVEELCRKAGWTYDSYYLAAFFDHEGLLTEIGGEA